MPKIMGLGEFEEGKEVSMFKSKWLKRIAILLTVVMVLGSVPVFAEGVNDDFVTIDELEEIVVPEEDLDAEEEAPADLEEQEEDQEEPADPEDSEPAEDEKDTEDPEGPAVEMEEELVLDAAAVVWDGSIADGFAGGTGTESNPYLISTPSQLAYLAQIVNNGNKQSGRYFKLTNDIILNQDGGKPIEWVPIGGMESFYGNLDGSGYSIYGLYINTEHDYQGLFGYLVGTVSNLTIRTGSIKAGNYVGGISGRGGMVNGCHNYIPIVGNNYVGGITGNAEKANECRNMAYIIGNDYVGGISGGSSGTIRNCENRFEIVGRNNVGGIAGSAGNVEDCINYADVNGVSRVGGICGNTDYTTAGFNRLTNEGNVNGTGSYLGGILGRAYYFNNTNLTLDECKNIGNITTEGDYAGGILGYAYYRVHGNNLENTGDVNGRHYVGGLIGYQSTGYSSYWGQIEDGRNEGNITGENYVGGLVGDGPAVLNSENFAIIQGSNYVGGILGSWGTATDCINYASVTGVDYVGGIVGNGSATACMNLETVAGNDYVGGIAGGIGTIDNCQNKGLIWGKNYVGGIAGGGSGAVRNCENHIEIVGYNNVGGIVGAAITIEDCANYADVTGISRVGGICGNTDYTTVNMNRLINKGNISGTGSYVAGIVGRADRNNNVRMYLTECVNYGNILSEGDYVGGIAGYTYFMLSGSSLQNVGDIKGNDYVAGLIGYQSNGYTPNGTGEIENGVNSGNVLGRNNVGGIASYSPKMINMYNTGTIQSTSTRTNDLLGSGTNIVSSYFLDDTEASTSPYARTSAELKQQATFEGWDFEDVWSIEEEVSCPKLQWVEEMEPGEPTSFLWPTDSGEITLWHGQIDEQYQVFHKGMNIQGPLNSQVYSICDGIVTQISNDATFGTIIYVECKYQGSTLQIRYGNINPVSGLTVGQQTRQGDVIGTMRQGTGEVTNKGVAQIAMLMSGDFVNPQDYLDRPETNLAYLKRPMATVLDTTGLEVSSAYTFSVTARETLSNDKNGRYVQNLDLEDGEVYLRKIVLDCAHLLDPSVNNDNLEALGILIYDPVTNTATVNLNGKTMIYGVGLRSASGTASNQNDRLIVESDAFIKYAEVFEKALWYNTYQKTETFNINAQDRVDASVSAVIGVMSIEPTSEGVRQQQIAVGGVVYATPNLDSASDYARIQDVGLQIRVSDSDKLRVFTNQSADWLAWYPEEGDLTWSAVYGIFDTAFGMVEDQTHFSKIISMVQSFFSSGKKGIDRELVEFTWDYTSLTYVHEAAHYLKFRLELDESLTLTDWYTVRYYMFYSNRLLEIDNGKNYFIITRDVDGELTTQACTEEELLERMSDEEQVEFLIQKEIDKNELYIKTFADKDEDVVEIHLEQKEYLETLLEQVPDADQGELNAIRFELDRSREEVEVQMAEIFEM